MRFEYKHETYTPRVFTSVEGGQPETFEQWLNVHGADGWELVAMVSVPMDMTSDDGRRLFWSECTFKRAVRPERAEGELRHHEFPLPKAAAPKAER